MPFVLAIAILASTADVGTRLRDALAHERVGQDAQALSAVDAIIRTDPLWEIARLEAGRLRLKSGNMLDRAELDLDIARALAPENARAHHLWGLLMEERGQASEAIAAHRLAVLYRPDYEEARLRLAGLLFAAGDWAGSETHYRAAVAKNPALLTARAQLCDVLEKQKKTVEAEKELKRLRKEHPTNPMIAGKLADFYDRTGRTTDADRVRRDSGLAAKTRMRSLQKSAR